MARDLLKTAGSLLFVGGAEFLIAMTAAEALFPGYSVSGNRISDLGANCAGSACAIEQPSAGIFDVSVILLGLAGLAGGYLIFRSRYRAVGILAMMGGLGAMGVGIFPETTGVLHLIVSFITFFFTGLSAITSYRLFRPPMSYLGAGLGVFVLVALALYGSSTYLGLGPGGMERMIAYPALIWVVGAGANLMGAQQRQELP
ncbi:MAG: DUF998 domain-containing protein [Thaumarchaeota archaeon]|nr:DUF998 domain-containing protein [Nitrososphaerota archaeon]